MKKLPNLKPKRKEKGFTVEHMSEQLKISIRTYRAYEQGARNPLLETTFKILEILDCSLEDLTKEEEYKED